MLFLETTSLNDFAPDRMDQIEAPRAVDLVSRFLERSLGRQGAALLAHPEMKPESGLIEWSASLSGTALPLSSLAYEDGTRLRSALGGLARRLDLISRPLINSGDKRENVAGTIIGQIALSLSAFLAGSPSPLGVYQADDLVVLSNWGVSFKNPPAAPDPEREMDAELILKTGVLPARCLPPSPLPEAAVSWEGPGAEEDGGWNLLRTLAAAVSTLLLLFLFSLLIFPDLKNFFFEKTKVYNFSEEKSLALKAFQLRRDYLSGLPACPELASESDLPTPETLPKEQPRESLEAANASGGLLSVEKPPPVLAEGDALMIPEEGDPDDLAFLKGCWKSDAGLFNSRTTLPVINIYCMDEAGTGSILIEQYDKKGNHLEDCVGKAKARREGKSVVIENDGPVCAKSNSRFSVDILTCETGKNQRASCRVQNEGSLRNKKKPYFDATFTYLKPQ
ncbi:MAG: hypothetical protein LBR53_04940 [Deltaproteobacteria bacterium]|nr:hypothetical protein [Deltaproteobacteria bacterium]